MSETPLPRRHEESPRPRLHIIGRDDRDARVTFSARTQAGYDSSPCDTESDFRTNPDRDLPSDRIIDGRRSNAFAKTLPERPFGNGVLESFRSSLPTPPDAYERDLTASVLAHRLERIEIELRNFVDAVRCLAETLGPKDAA